MDFSLQTSRLQYGVLHEETFIITAIFFFLFAQETFSVSLLQACSIIGRDFKNISRDIT